MASLRRAARRQTSLLACYFFLLPWARTPQLGELAGKTLVLSDLAFLLLVLHALTRGRRLLRSPNLGSLIAPLALLMTVTASFVATGAQPPGRLEILRVGYGTVVLLLLSHVRVWPERLRAIARAYCAASFCLAVLGLGGLVGTAVFGLGPNPFAEHNSPNLGESVVRLSGPLSSNSLVPFWTLGLAFASLLAGTARRLDRGIAIASAAAVAIAAPFTASRTLVGLAVAVVFCGWALRPRLPSLGRAAVALAPATAALAAGVVFVTILAVDRSGVVTDEQGAARRSAYRVLHQAALRMVASHPIFGVGPGRFGLEFPRYADSDQARGAWPPVAMVQSWDPHSTWLGLLAQCGLSATLGLGALGVWLMGTLGRSEPASFGHLALGCLAALAIACFTVDLLHLKFTWAFAGLSAAWGRSALGRRDRPGLNFQQDE
jgi:hypothetical protein